MSNDFNIKDLINKKFEIKLSSYIIGKQFPEGLIFDNLKFGNIYQESIHDNAYSIEQVKS